MDDNTDKKNRPPPAVFSAAPEKELEEKLKEQPENLDAKVDVGSDESMDASDPPSVVRTGSGEPVPSSSSPDESAEEDGKADD